MRSDGIAVGCRASDATGCGAMVLKQKRNSLLLAFGSRARNALIWAMIDRKSSLFVEPDTVCVTLLEKLKVLRMWRSAENSERGKW